MTRRRLFLLLSVVLIIGMVLYLKENSPDTPIAFQRKSHSQKLEKFPAPQDKKSPIRLPSAEVKATPTINASNTISDAWEENLESSLRVQGGPSLKDVKIEKLDSLIWKQDGIALHVETVRITLTNDKSNQTSFKVMVDSQTGKILKNWDQPVFDPANPREKFKLALDPRYHND
jgi:hypothetical protein